MGKSNSRETSQDCDLDMPELLLKWDRTVREPQWEIVIGEPRGTP